MVVNQVQDKACVAEYKSAVYRKNKIVIQFCFMNTLKRSCKKNGIKINIEVLNDEVEWAKGNFRSGKVINNDPKGYDFTVKKSQTYF